MKTSQEILKEIENTKNQLTTKAEEAYSLYYEELRQALEDKGIAKYKEMKMSEKLQALKIEYENEHKQNTFNRLKLEILKDNLAQIIFHENIAKICEIWNKYEGKPYGEKTKEKITSEIEQATGIRARIYSQYDYTHIDLSGGVVFDFFGYRGLQAGAIYEQDQPKQDCLDANNKILKIDPSKNKLYYFGEYVANVEDHALEIIRLHEKARQAEKAFEDAISEYNHARRGKMQQASRSEGVKRFILQ